MANRDPWQKPGYSDIAAAGIVDGALSVTFENGDVVLVPNAVSGDLEGASVMVDPEALEVIVSPSDGAERRISWTQIRAGADAAFAQHLRELDADESRRLGRRLKALREDRGITQSELAALVNMTAPQLSKIEKGAHDMRLSTVRSLLRALNATFADVSGDDLPEISLKKLAQRIASTGLPKETAGELLLHVPRRYVHALLGRAFGWTREAVLANNLRPVPLGATVQFKTAAQQEPEESPLIHLAWAVARAARAAAPVQPYQQVPADPAAVRARAQAAHGDVTLASLLEWTWQRGIPVVPMSGRGAFFAAVWAVQDGPVIVLKEARDIAVFWLFDLAHELGHIAYGHVSGESIVDVASPTSATALDSTDQQEREANEFAMQLLVPDYRALLQEVRHRSGGNYLAFKGAVAATAARNSVNAGVLGMLAAHEISEVGEHKDRWGSATNLAKSDGEGRTVAVELARRRLQLDSVDELDAALLEVVVLGE